MIFTLCGSARFEPVWHEANKQLGLAGHISFSLMTFPSVEGDKTWYTPDKKIMLDLMHLAKIDASDAVLMLNVNDYLGESSLRELRWAQFKNKEIFWLEPPTLWHLKDGLAKDVLSLDQWASLNAVLIELKKQISDSEKF